MKLTKIYCRTPAGESFVLIKFQEGKEALFDRYNPQLSHLSEIISLYGISLSALFKAYEDNIPIKVGGEVKLVSAENILSAFSELMRENKISRAELARRMGVDKTYLSSLFSQRYSTDLRMYTIKRISGALGFKLSQVFLLAEKISLSI